MSKEKRSFFERLTGTVAIDGEEEVVKTTTKSGHGNAWTPEEADEGQLTVDVYQNGGEIVLQSMVAGVAPENLNISITRDMVTIKGRRDAPSNISNENYFNKELYWGSFSRTVLLPQEIEPEEAEATQRHGLLTLRLPKVDKEKVREIKVKVV